MSHALVWFGWPLYDLGGEDEAGTSSVAKNACCANLTTRVRIPGTRMDSQPSYDGAKDGDRKMPTGSQARRPAECSTAARETLPQKNVQQ